MVEPVDTTVSTSDETKTMDEAPSVADVQDEGRTAVSSRECALLAARAADSKKASDIMVQDVHELIGVTDYFVIVTAGNTPQVEAIVEAIEESLKKDGHRDPLHREFTSDGSWTLLDYGDLVIHVFKPETREYYRLEALWNDAPIIDLAQEAGLTDIVYSERIAAMLSRHDMKP